MEKLPLSPALFDRIRAMLLDTAGLQFDDSKFVTLQSHLTERARLARCTTLEAYVDLISKPGQGEEFRKFVESVTIHETSFFRNHEHFRALREQVLPDLARTRASTRRLRIWSAGCSTGEEPYSLAITCMEHPQLQGWDIHIEATDLSERVLELAQRGHYRPGALRYLEADRVARWFHKQDAPPAVPRRTGPLDPVIGHREVFAISDKVRQLVHFGPLNLARVPYPDRYKDFDLILCENVIIYLRPDVTKGVIDSFYNRLQPGGYLFLGYSETLWQISDRFELMTAPNTFYYRRPTQELDPAAPPAARSSGYGNTDGNGGRAGSPGTAPSTLNQSPSGRLLGTPPPTTRPAPPARPVSGPGLTPTAAAPRPAPAAAEMAVVEARRLTAQALELVEAGKYAEAQAAFEAALARNPAWVDALVGLAQIHANQGRLAEARAECTKALDIDSLCEEGHLLAALIARQQNRTAEAIDHFEKLLYINFESVAGHFHFAELYRSQNRPADAAREYRRTLWALDRHQDATVSGLPAAMIQRACEQQLQRLQA
jgi:chemotaxis protein methyltransferase CheR